MSVSELRQPVTFAALSDRVEDEIERAYWHCEALIEQEVSDGTE